ncbi:hypothetical protein EVJ58_g1678 [Rhodofomes roseus]|uniref:Uncharacterized protein n=1 Tax=Rhodofomes roseus TaxID=34475 RepID=A0A4Y9Z0G1_9APHY|nr:hypothetical protein EVJ58_g1678 [Rhodofomes roseus]
MLINYARSTSDLEVRGDFDSLEARNIDEEVFAREVYEGLEARDFEDDVLFARDFDEDLFARDLDDNQFIARALGVNEELVARSKIGNRIKHAFQKIGHVLGKVVKGVAHLILKREDMDVLARELGIDEELFARAFEDHGLFARSFDEYEFARRGFPEELFTRMLMEELDARGVEEPQQVSQPDAAHLAEQPHAHEMNGAAGAHRDGKAHTGGRHNGRKHAGAYRNGKKRTGAHRKGEHRGAHSKGEHAQHRQQGTQHRQQTGEEHHEPEGAVLDHQSTQHHTSEHPGAQEHPGTQERHSTPETREDVLELLARALSGEFDELD